jgi:hypothetical protein
LTYISETIPLATGSRILCRNQCKLAKYDARYEIWRVYGSFAECISFGNNDVCDLDDEELEQLVRKFVDVRKGSAITINRTVESTFVIFNFV